MSARYEERIDALEADAALGRIVRESRIDADDFDRLVRIIECGDTEQRVLSCLAIGMFKAIAAELRKERGRG